MKTLLTALCLVLGLVSLVDALPEREVAADALASASKLFCHRSFQTAGSWAQVAVGFPGAYAETDQNAADATICGFRSGGKTNLYSTIGAPSVGAGLNGKQAMQISGQTGLTSVEAVPGAQPYQQGGITGRMGYRWYSYMSDSETCQAAKLIQLGLYWTLNSDYPGGQHDGPLTWQGAGEQMPNFAASNMRGKWFRLEGYLDNYANPTTNTLIVKNITDNGPELSRTVSTTCVSGGSFCQSNQLANFTQWIHMYRDNRAAPGGCTNRYMYLLVGKNLGATERLPVASEVETGGVTPPPPPPPPPPTSCVITPTPVSIAFTHPVGGPLPAPKTVSVVTSDGSGYRTFDTGFYDAAPCYAATCASGTVTTITPMPTTLTMPAGVYSYPLDLTAGSACATVTVPVTLTIGSVAPPPPPPAAALSVYITQPKANATVKGTVWVVMWVEGTSAGSNIFTLSADGTQIATRTTTSKGPVSFPWQTQSLMNGSHTLAGTVRDAAGNTGTKSITVIVTH